MSSLFSKPKMPEVRTPDPIPPQDRTADQTAELAAEQRRKYGTGGTAQTWLTGGTGASTGSTTSRFLGGAART